MGCIDKFGGILIAIVIIILGIMVIQVSMSLGIGVIVGGVAFGILTFVLDLMGFMDLTELIEDSPLIGLFKKFLVNLVISAVIAFIVFIVIEDL